MKFKSFRWLLSNSEFNSSIEHSSLFKIISADVSETYGYPLDRTLFMINPPLSILDELKENLDEMFSRYGKIERVDIRDNDNKLLTSSPYTNCHSLVHSGQYVYIVFESSDAVDLLCSSDAIEPKEWKSTHKQPLGLSRWKRLYKLQHPSVDEYEKSLDAFIKKYDETVQKEFEEMKNKTNIVDDDGWTLVTRAGKRGANTDGKITVFAANPLNLLGQKRKSNSLDDFYRFQMRENKKEKLEKLQKRFEQDKKKIAAMKRSFKPF